MVIIIGFKRGGYAMTVEQVKQECYWHHTSWAKGYLSRKNGGEHKIYSYDGKYGKGYTVEHPSWESTRYHYISYYIFKDGKK